MPLTSSPGTAPHVSGELLTALRGGDESALETLFRARYDSLIEAARRKVEEKEVAPKLVERAIVHLWQRRDGLQTPEQFEAALHEAVREEAAREAKRRAVAMRMAHLEGAKASKHAPAHHGPVDVNESWKHVQTALHARHVDTAELAKAGRHHAAEHIGEITKPRSKTVPIVAGVLTIVGVAGGVLFMERAMADAAVNTAIASNAATEQKTGVGQRGTVTLPDSTAVILGAETVLRVARGFATDNRAVKVTGTASFTVRQNTEQPFKIKVQDAFVTATGTVIDVSAYPADSLVVVRVREGTAELKVEKEMHPLRSGQALAIEHGGRVRAPTEAELLRALAWTEGRLALSNVTLRRALEDFERWYGLHIAAHNPALLERRVTMSASLDSVRRAIDHISSSSGLAFGYAGSNMILYDPANKPAGVR
jgi:ferric-dicitrate binding protein FerR (iron transport regulator)